MQAGLAPTMREGPFSVSGTPKEPLIHHVSSAANPLLSRQEMRASAPAPTLETQVRPYAPPATYAPAEAQS